MKRINEYKKLFQIESQIDLAELKQTYRKLVKQWHPDKFHADEDGRIIAEEKSKTLIEAYHFLVSIAPETMEQNLPQYNETINAATILDYQYKGQTLQISFSDGNTYEYFDVPKAIYIKLHNAETQGRFARRHICTSFVYRNVGKMVSE